MKRASWVNPSTHRLRSAPTAPAQSAVLGTEQTRAVLVKMQAALASLQATLTEADFPPAACYPHSPHYLSNLNRLTISGEVADGFYDINYIQGYVQIGADMLQALCTLSDENLVIFTQEFLLHETLHVDQRLYSTSWFGIQYASVVLEDMDYFADAFAVSTLIAWNLRVNPQIGFQEIVKSVAFITIRGLQVFDQIDYPVKMEQINDARLRRYLIWYTEYERLLACRTYPQVLENLFPRIFVEIANLYGTLDADGVKEITTCTAEAEYFLALRGRLERQADMPGFDIVALFNGILAYDDEAVFDQIRYVVMEGRSLLVTQL